MQSELKWLLLVVLTALSLKVAAGWLTDRRALAQNTKKEVVAPEPKSIYLGLREQALNLKREKIGLPTPAKPTQPWAALMDWGLPQTPELPNVPLVAPPAVAAATVPTVAAASPFRIPPPASASDTPTV